MASSDIDRQAPVIETVPAGPLETNCYLFGYRSTGRGVIIDPGGEADRILRAFEATGLALVAIINTHAHFDHAGGNRRLRELTGAPLLIHRADAPILASLSMQAMLFMIRSENSPPPDAFLEDGQVIDLGAGGLRVIHTPGHTPGGICLYAPGVLFSGDTLFSGSVGRTDLPGGSWRDLMASIGEKLLALPDDTTVYPGHGAPTTIAAERTSNPFLGSGLANEHSWPAGSDDGP